MEQQIVMLWISTPRFTVGLEVNTTGVVVEPCPPYARKWALGKDAHTIAREYRRRGARIHWIRYPNNLKQSGSQNQ